MFVGVDHKRNEILLGWCHGLLAAGSEVAADWYDRGGGPVRSTVDLMISSMFSRSTRAYEAIVRHLGIRGDAEQGTMLNRSLWEDMVDAHWTSINGDLAVEDQAAPGVECAGALEPRAGLPRVLQRGAGSATAHVHAGGDQGYDRPLRPPLHPVLEGSVDAGAL